LMFHQISSLWGLKSDVCQKVWMEQKIIMSCGREIMRRTLLPMMEFLVATG